jgi:hypothetical protein
VPAVGCLGWLLGLGAWWFAWLVCLRVGCLELDKACYLATGRRLKGPFESCAPPSNKGKLCVCQLNLLTLIQQFSPLEPCRVLSMILKRSDAAKIALYFCGKACYTSNLLGSSTWVRYKVGSFRSPSEVHHSLRPCSSAYRRFRRGSWRASQLCPSTGGVPKFCRPAIYMQYILQNSTI